jgi:phosphoadenosine phosphosulfate reductase
MSELNRKIDEAAGLIDSVLESGRGAPCVTSSFQTDCMALLDLVLRREPGIPVLFLDTGYHFAETYAYRDQMAARFGLNLVNLTPKLTVEQQETTFGILYQSAPDRCCGMRKVEPLFEGLAPFEVWFTALRREQSPTRANLQPAAEFTLPGGKRLLKVSPLAAWTNQDVWAYLKRREIPALPLYERGYTSIGCEPCTAPPLDADNLRSGRWAGKQKLECGIHVSG